MLKPASHLLDHVLPVIDLKRGQVVHAVAGQRSQYQPLRSQLVDSIHPGRVAKALRERVGSSEVYVADLDAIEGESPDWNSFRAMENAGSRLWIDAGVSDVAAMKRFLTRMPNVHRIIVGLESLSKLRDIEKLCAAIPREQIVFSLDLQDGTPITDDPAAQRMSAESIAAYVSEEGVSSLIVLDLASVGASNGGESTIDLCRKVRSRNPEIEITSGGGVRNLDDVRRFVEAGCDRVLVATAIHRGALIR